MTRVTRKERAIAKALGVTDSGLHTLLRIKRGDPISGGNAVLKLIQQGYVEIHCTKQGFSQADTSRRSVAHKS